MAKTFCPIPWNFQAVRNNGDLRICCQANVTPNKGVIRHPNGVPMNASRDSMDDARNAELMRSVRKNIIDGVWSPECKRCQVEEESGLASRRQYEIENWKMSLDDVLPYTNIEDGSVDIERLPVTYYDLRFGNLCNLACRMCGPEDSHTWYEQWSKYIGKEEFNDTHGKVILVRNDQGRLTTNDYDWHSFEYFWKQIEQNINNIQKIYMAGGEPLMIERHYEFLSNCIQNDTAKNIELEYNTNGTTLPNKVFDLWKHFKRVNIGISIDGIGDVVEYQRWPAKWSQLYNNLLKINNKINSMPNINVWLAVTVTAYNVMHMAEMIEWKIFDSGLNNINISNHKPIISPHVAHRPQNTNIRVLPNEIKNEIRNTYDKSLNKLVNAGVDEKYIKSAKSIYDSIVKYMTAEDWTEQWFSDFIEFTNFLDKERNQDITKIIPLLTPYFKQKDS